MYPLCVHLVGDEGQKARKSKQEAFPTLETVFTKLQLLSYFDQHQVTSQVAITADFLRSWDISLKPSHAVCVFSLRCFINAFLKCIWKCLKTGKWFSFKCRFTFLRGLLFILEIFLPCDHNQPYIKYSLMQYLHYYILCPALLIDKGEIC